MYGGSGSNSNSFSTKNRSMANGTRDYRTGGQSSGYGQSTLDSTKNRRLTNTGLTGSSTLNGSSRLKGTLNENRISQNSTSGNSSSLRNNNSSGYNPITHTG